MKLSKTSESKLIGVHPDLVKVVRRAVELCTELKLDFVVLEGVRTIERQRQLVAKGASKTLRSRHIPRSNKSGNSCAVDIAPYAAGQARWDWPLYHNLAPVIKQAAEDVGVPIEWGGDWKSFPDGPHWQLPAKEYPYA